MYTLRSPSPIWLLLMNVKVFIKLLNLPISLSF